MLAVCVFALGSAGEAMIQGGKLPFSVGLSYRTGLCSGSLLPQHYENLFPYYIYSGQPVNYSSALVYGQYATTDQWIISLGAGFTSKGSSRIAYPMQWSGDNAGVYSYRDTYRHYFVDLPLQLHYKAYSFRRVDLLFNGGIAANIYAGSAHFRNITYVNNKVQSSRSDMDDKTIFEGSPYTVAGSFRPWHADAVVGTGLRYRLDAVSVQLDLAYRHTLGNVLVREETKLRYSSFGAEFGVSYNF